MATMLSLKRKFWQKTVKWKSSLVMIDLLCEFSVYLHLIIVVMVGVVFV